MPHLKLPRFKQYIGAQGQLKCITLIIINNNNNLQSETETTRNSLLSHFRPSWWLFLVGGHPTPKTGKWWLQRRWKHRSQSALGSNWLWKWRVLLGYKQTAKMIRQGKALTRSDLVMLDNICPALRESEIEHYPMLAKTSVHHKCGNSPDLGTVCRKYYRVCMQLKYRSSCLPLWKPILKRRMLM